VLYHHVFQRESDISDIRRVADMSLAFPVCSTTKKFFLNGLKKPGQRSHVCVCGAQGGICRVNKFIFSIP
jgi:hypothetical protein